MSLITGRIHSTESFGTVDGPGIRFVVFLQGCPLRCKYCHNPDTWAYNGGKEMTAEQLLDEYNGCREFYKDGGITVTGGEPLLQIDFVTELFELAKSRGIHTCLDTSGITFNDSNKDRFDRLIKSTDLILLDLKHIDSALHKELTAHGNENILAFARYLADNNIPMWIRHVVVPGLTDDEEQHYKLGRFIGTLRSVKALDVLPYHDMGVPKYEALGIDYPLKGTEPATKELALKTKQAIMRGIKDVRAGR
ncbi:MAG: pyruvate formate lyase-activating protein [Ruminococcaceae bacterium]|nr:pyruvate formate lyase-activating protein [Oscillospiraceae bacterium]